jgi:peptide deformylase
MALRLIVKEGEDILNKKCRPVEKFDEKLFQLLEDMKETMYAANGVGLAAPQICVLRRVCVIDIGDGPIEMINPVITKTSGVQESSEGCLSSPGEYGLIRRPAVVKLQAQNREGKFFIITVEGLAAECADHENDHMDGILFKSKVERMLAPDEIGN